MPIIRLPKVRIGFLKKLLHKKPKPDTAATNPAIDGPDKQQDEKAALQQLPLEECPICHDPVGLKNPEGVMESWVHLHCGHKFGTQCIQTWLEESAEREPHSVPTCPICRTTARHPCGHPVSLPALRFLPPFSMWEPMPPSPPPPPTPHQGRRRPRRRLSRRWGHPHRPSLPRAERTLVQTVGKCSTCAATAAAEEKRMRQMTTPSVELSGTTNSGRVRNNHGNLERRTGIKSMLMQTTFRRLSISGPESPRNESHNAFADTISARSPTLPHRQYMGPCRTEVIMARSPTPAPPMNRLSSF
ncbi:hypothetical protein GGR55DRAFT_437710 [Xylaria sp. FL0064]|nr:hypothetical protein GGR55DRAFT_437710 [Xylaria sp. FL0064]